MAAIHTFYEVIEEKGGFKLLRRRKVCPRCGAGVFLAEHKDRYSCGKCGYTEFRKAKN
ncbi:MAG TPA: 30S ribosomal protein S27ae [Methanophagales archaeon]|nr:30S ribosomal protein S27ae [Methanophagales archaeon]